MKEIDYYKNNEILENSYYQIPQELFINKLYKEKLNSDSKILYAFLLDRLSLSQKNHWFDELNRVYLIFTREEVQDKLCLSEKTVTKAFKQLTDTNLIAEKRQGLGKPNLIYVGKIQHEEIITNIEIERLYYADTLKVGSVIITNSKILSKLALINKNNLIQLLDIAKSSNNIKNITNYLMICLYNNLGNCTIKSQNKTANSNRECERKYPDGFFDSLYANFVGKNAVASS